MRRKIAILGATSHVAKGLIYNFLKDNKEYTLFLFARSPERVREFLKSNSLKGNLFVSHFGSFGKKQYDAVINCVGMGTPTKLRDGIRSIFFITEEYDSLMMRYLKEFPRSYGINFSSGAVYGSNFNDAVNENSTCALSINNIRPQDYYTIAKINAEAKHRSYPNLAIVDIRLFSYFSRFIDLDAGYFLTDALKSIKEGKEFITTESDFTRDYLHHLDLFSLVTAILNNKPFNAPLDAYSREPVTKRAVLDYFVKKYGLRYKVDYAIDTTSPTGAKDIYYSDVKKAASLGYIPQFTSLQTIAQETEFILG
jgi:nucleoside-diphosphate-sugar epimerase